MNALHGAGSDANSASTCSSAPARISSTRPARWSCRNVAPPRYVAPRSVALQAISGSSSVREQLAAPADTSIAYRPSFQEQNRSSTSTTTPAVAHEAARLQRGGHVDESHAQPVGDPQAQAPRLFHQERQWLVDRTVPGLHPIDQVHVEQVPPDVRVRVRGGRHQLTDGELELGDGVGPLVLDAIRRVRVGLAVGLVDRVERRLVLLGLLLEEEPLPPRVVHGDHAGSARLRAIVDRAHRRQRLGARKQPHAADRVIPADERGPAPFEVDLAEERREAVAEAAVDAALGRVQHRDRLAARMDVVQLCPHERGVDAAPPVRRLDADGGDAGPRHLRAAGNREAVAGRRRSPDDPAVVERRVPSVQLEDESFAGHVLGGDVAAERQLERAQAFLEFGVDDRADLDVHPPSLSRVALGQSSPSKASVTTSSPGAHGGHATMPYARAAASRRSSSDSSESKSDACVR